MCRWRTCCQVLLLVWGWVLLQGVLSVWVRNLAEGGVVAGDVMPVGVVLVGVWCNLPRFRGLVLIQWSTVDNMLLMSLPLSNPLHMPSPPTTPATPPLIDLRRRDPCHVVEWRELVVGR